MASATHSSTLPARLSMPSGVRPRGNEPTGASSLNPSLSSASSNENAPWLAKFSLGILAQGKRRPLVPRARAFPLGLGGEAPADEPTISARLFPRDQRHRKLGTIEVFAARRIRRSDATTSLDASLVGGHRDLGAIEVIARENDLMRLELTAEPFPQFSSPRGSLLQISMAFSTSSGSDPMVIARRDQDREVPGGRVIEAPLIRPTSSGFVDSAAARGTCEVASVASRNAKATLGRMDPEYEHLGWALDEAA